MENAVSLKSLTNELGRYVSSRFITTPVLLLLVLLMLASWSAAPPSRHAIGLLDATLLALLVLQFRLWDDLVDVISDRLRHPDRVLVQASSLTPFYVLLAVLFALTLSITAWSRPWPAAALLLAFEAMLAVWYRGRDDMQSTLNYHLVLGKYPLIVLIVGARSEGAMGAHLALAASSVFLFLCVYEVLHDVCLRTRVAVQAARLECLALLLMLIVVAAISIGGESAKSDNRVKAPAVSIPVQIQAKPFVAPARANERAR